MILVCRSSGLWKFLPLLLLIATLPAVAQVGLYGEFSATHINVANEPEIYGITFGGYSDKSFEHHLTFLSVGPDVRLSLQSGTASNGGRGGRPAQSLISILGGPRVAFNLPVAPVARLHPYVEGLFGGGDSQIGEQVSDGYPPPANSSQLNKNGGGTFESQILGGLDLKVHPHVDWRVVEGGYAQFISTGSPGLNIMTLSTGIVIRLP